MTEENKTATTTTEEPENNDYLEIIKGMKDELGKTKTELKKEKENNSKLIRGFLNDNPAGASIVGTEDTEHEKVYTEKEINSLRFDILRNQSLSNLEYWKKALELRKATLQKTGEDIFMPKGHKVNTNDPIDKEAVERVVDVVQECIDYADGDSELFTQELQRRTDDATKFLRR